MDQTLQIWKLRKPGKGDFKGIGIVWEVQYKNAKKNNSFYCLWLLVWESSEKSGKENENYISRFPQLIILPKSFVCCCTGSKGLVQQHWTSHSNHSKDGKIDILYQVQDRSNPCFTVTVKNWIWKVLYISFSNISILILDYLK